MAGDRDGRPEDRIGQGSVGGMSHMALVTDGGIVSGGAPQASDLRVANSCCECCLCSSPSCPAPSLAAPKPPGTSPRD